jgi:hypothetical protein
MKGEANLNDSKGSTSELQHQTMHDSRRTFRFGHNNLFGVLATFRRDAPARLTEK